MITATTRTVLPFLPSLIPPNQSQHRVLLGSYPLISHISNVLNVMWTLCNILQTTSFVFIHLQTLFCKTGGYMTNSHQLKMKTLKGREPRTAWGEAIRGLGVTARTGP
jgi:hypothetical protein